MAETSSTKKKMGWVSEYSGKEYEDGDETLVGMGNPPCCPEYCRDNPGAGHLPMKRAVLK